MILIGDNVCLKEKSKKINQGKKWEKNNLNTASNCRCRNTIRIPYNTILSCSIPSSSLPQIT